MKTSDASRAEVIMVIGTQRLRFSFR